MALHQASHGPESLPELAANAGLEAAMKYLADNGRKADEVVVLLVMKGDDARPDEITNAEAMHGRAKPGDSPTKVLIVSLLTHLRLVLKNVGNPLSDHEILKVLRG